MKTDIENIRKEFHRSEEARYVHRLHGVLLVLLGLSTVKAGKLLGDPQRTIAHWVIRFKAHGLDGLKEAEKSGRPEILNAAQKSALAVALTKSPKDAGLKADVWTSALASVLLDKRYGIKISPRQCSRILASLKKSNESIIQM